MTTGNFQYLDPSTLGKEKPWAKVDGPGYSFTLAPHQRSVTNARTASSADLHTDTSGFAVYNSPAKEKAFADDVAVREGYYAEVEALLKSKLAKVKKVTIFDHTIRKHDPSSARQPVQQVHVDQSPAAAAARVRRHLPAEEAEELLKGRYQIINVWRPISHAATDFPLAVIDWRTTKPEDFVRVDLMYPDRETNGAEPDDDDRGKEALPDPNSKNSTVGYSVKGETMVVRPNDSHQFYYFKDMTPDEAMFIKCFDSRSQWMNDEGYASGEEGRGKGEGVEGRAACTPHTAFIDPATPENTPGRQSIEVRCLVFYDE